MDAPGHAPRAAGSPERQSLAALRAQAAELGSVEALRLLGRALADDPRAGARALGERCLRRAERRAEGERKLRRMLERRDALLAGGARAVAGVDEVGVGPLAGPVVAAAVVLPRDCDLVGLDDSKKVPRASRERLAHAIREQAVAVGIGRAEVDEIDRINVYRAALEAMRRAVEALSADCAPDHLLVDARTVPGVSIRQSAIVHGDARDASIAAASIVAKVYRDAHMAELDVRYPGYGLARHMGYGTAEHLHALRELGPSPVHRHSFAPVAEAARR